MPLIKKIISGGQTGADRAALDAAQYLGVPTGGWCPKGFRTESGIDPSLKKSGLRETRSGRTVERTIKNVSGSDGTVIFTSLDKEGKFTGSGTRLTYDTAMKLNKPCLVNPDKITFLSWLYIYRIRVLNVAGNRQSLNSRIYKKTYAFLVNSFSERINITDIKPAVEFIKALRLIKAENKSGSAHLLDMLIDSLIAFFKSKPRFSNQDTIRFLNNMIGYFLSSALDDFQVLKSFFEEIRCEWMKNCHRSSLNENMLKYLGKYKSEWSKANEKIYRNIAKEIKFNNKTILLHSNSSTVRGLFSYLKARSRNIKFIQTESRPMLEGRLQAEYLAKLGYSVTLIPDAAFAQYIREIDFCILGADGIYKTHFVNKTGSYLIAILFKMFFVPFYVLADNRKIDSKRKSSSVILKSHPSSEIWGKQLKNLNCTNNYFELIPNKFIKKIYTNNK
jgi:translation initiation factor 2B subunit (eIF-2B alpha/beta/delta family)